jgi:hypothetical protein
MKDPNTTITMTATYVAARRTTATSNVIVKVNAREALRTGYISDDPNFDDYVLCPTEVVLGELKPDLDKVGVLREFLPVFDHIVYKGEAADIVAKQMARYDEVLALSKAENEKKAKPSENPPRDTLAIEDLGNVQSTSPETKQAVRETRERKERSRKERPVVELHAKYRLTREAHEAALVNNICTSTTQSIDFNVDAEEAIRAGYATLDGRFSIGDMGSTFSKLEPDLEKEGVVRRPSRDEFDHILTASDAVSIVTKEMKRYDEVLAVSQKVQELKVKNQSTAVVLVGAYLLTEEAHKNLALSGTETTRIQHVPVVLDAKEAVRTKYATIDKYGHIILLGSDQTLFQEIKPNPRRLETIRYIPSSMKEFDHILSVEEATKIVTDEMVRFDEVLAASKAEGEAITKEREETWAKERAASKALEEERQKVKNGFLAELNCYMPRIVAGEPCVIDSNEHGTPVWFKIDGKGIDVRYDLLDSQEREMVKKTLSDERRKRADAEIAAWIKEHGSPRLKKAVEAGILWQIRGAYRSERLAIELPGWMFLSDEKQDHISDRLNPSENEIDAFIEAKKRWPEGDVRLSSVRIFKAPASEGWFRSFLVMKCPFHNALIGLHLNENDVSLAERVEASSENANEPMSEIKEAPLEK